VAIGTTGQAGEEQFHELAARANFSAAGEMRDFK
jgi:hypothetical protein